MSSTCQGVTKRETPCSITWGLDANGFCQYHKPNAAQCKGVARSTGRRCEVKWNLDDQGFCIRHSSQSPVPPTTAVSNACKGVTKRGTPCSVTWGLDINGFCKYHKPDASRCKGLARATGRRCKIKWSLDERGYCQFHRRVEATATNQCEAVVAATGRRCTQTVGIDDDGFCTAHRAVNREQPKCQGLLPDRRESCGNNVKVKGYKYCCAAHDPKFANSYVAPKLFNDPGLRKNVEGDIVKFFKGRDLYHGDKLDLNTVGAVELDHILEKQCFAFAFQRAVVRDADEVQDLAYLLREEVVNELPNLCLTRATTNKIKGAAVSKFLDDSLTGHRGSRTLADYLLAEKRDDTRLTRDVTRTIRREMGAALRRCQRKLRGVGDNRICQALSAELHQLYVDMDLHTSHGGSIKVEQGDKDDEYVLVDSVSTDSWTVVDVKRTVSVEYRQPTLSAEAKPFVPGSASTDSQRADTAKYCKQEPHELKKEVNGNSSTDSEWDKIHEVKRQPTTSQVSSESTSEEIVKEKYAKRK
ncbi:hypothetical protein P3T76_015878 [Phytophthora citrophthora]|uniref:Uncharacterized protein n=1 Tax=Phytophthora citrophthora TaxID=4793 RepID=A0AAD9FZ48_9STRA|nr:hypothetical protein P3T76_015878 [Phytophthora citrophthora]